MNDFDGIGKKDVCDSCGWNKIIVFVDEFGNGFCSDCNNQRIEQT